MLISQILSPEGVRVLSSMSSKKRLFQEIAELSAAACGTESETLFSALQDRENLGPTGVGKGVALPHARVDSLDTVRGAFIRLEKPLNFDAVDRQPVDLVFALFAPEGAGVEHLKALALVSRTLRDAAVRTKLRANADPATIYTILTEAQTSQAA